MTITTRFAPSPTGFLHIGGARTALFNYLFAKRHGGKYLLRIEDTDRKRSTEPAVEAIIEGLNWLELSGDNQPVFQHSRQERHKQVAKLLLEQGKAYKCYCSPEELEEMRSLARKEGKTALYDRRWRDRDPSSGPSNIDPVIRIKSPLEGATTIDDLVQGSVEIKNEQLDDFIILRADGTPTYMLSVVVDDHDMGISHVIRGDDHLNNAFRQQQLFSAMDWATPKFAHIPLIHGQDGTKLSKRHGALGIDIYKDQGYLPEAVCNYLLRLGWGHENDEIIPREKAVKLFDIGAVGKSPSRFDIKKLESINGVYIRQADENRLLKLVEKRLRQNPKAVLNQISLDRIKRGLTGLKMRAKSIDDIASAAIIYSLIPPISMDEKAEAILHKEARQLITGLLKPFDKLTNWDRDGIEVILKNYATDRQVKFGEVAQPLRATLTGTTTSPDIFEVIEILGKEEVILRIKSVC
ncbi:MAG: glutamate--tRNA ligase [Nisaea sp.]|nr:glutamate--tRNA ligase [Nisaea sp.]MEC7971722.1 glutamate--tRNA ligase [Pseudomonadota bacterium]|tara:strand:- start:1173 stop:2570 length:1398 start_codon:yes stop_codon:yes gene_type:complete